MTSLKSIKVTDLPTSDCKYMFALMSAEVLGKSLSSRMNLAAAAAAVSSDESSSRGKVPGRFCSQSVSSRSTMGAAVAGGVRSGSYCSTYFTN